MRKVVVLVGLLCALLLLAAMPAVATAMVRHSGYLEMPDGVKLRYVVFLPSDKGPFPVLLEYDGYQAGSMTPPRPQAKPFLDAGYAWMGLNVRGSGCSSGVFDVFHPVWGEDGARAVEWAARQPWSTGKVGMWGVSFSGYMQLWTAANRPPHLRAVAAGGVVTDPYRDVAYPGGIPNVLFPSVWWGFLTEEWEQAGATGASQGDAECAANAAQHLVSNQRYNVPQTIASHPYVDDFARERSAIRLTPRIQAPVLGIDAWQDEQVGSRGGHYYEGLNPETTWFVGANGGHGSYITNRFQGIVRRFYDHFLKGEDNGFERTPRVQIWHEVLRPQSTVPGWETAEDDPSWITTLDRLPVHVMPMRLRLGSGGRLAARMTSAHARPDTYAYPIPGAAAVFDNQHDWSVQPPGGGSLAYTTAPLPEDLTFFGSGSADLWLSSTAPDTDVQVTVTEVRPDGRETYVQRGWLRASHRALDHRHSTALRPVHPHTREAAQQLTPGEPALLRAEINTFSHTFRRGSSIRIWIDAPSETGLWGWAVNPQPATNSIWHDARHPSSVVLGYLPTVTGRPLPACGTLASQPCRRNAIPVPSGTGPAAPRSSRQAPHVRPSAGPARRRR